MRLCRDRYARYARPPARREVRYAWHDILLTYKKMRFWMYARRNRGIARRHAPRLRRLLAKQEWDPQALLARLIQSMIAELESDWLTAIRERRAMLEFLYDYLDRNPAEARHFMKNCDHFAWVSYGRLAEMEYESGELKAAIRTLETARVVCERYQLRFEAARLLAHLRMRPGATVL